jgi:hypothetical protein
MRGKNVTRPGSAGSPPPEGVAVQQRSTLAARAWPRQRERSTVNMADIEVPRSPRALRPPVATTRVRPAFQRRLTTRDGWLRVAEYVMGSWAATLYRAFLLAAGLVGVTVGIGAVFGFASIVLGAATIMLAGMLVGVVHFVVRRYRAWARANHEQAAGTAGHRQLRVVPGLAEQASTGRHQSHRRPAAFRRSPGNADPVRRLRVLGHEIHHHGRWCPAVTCVVTDPTTPGEPATREWPPPDMPRVRIPS